MKHGIRKTYTSVDVVPHEKHNNYELHLDGQPVKTQQGYVLMHRSLSLMEAVGQEWKRQAENIDINTMQLTRLLSALIDMDEDQLLLLQTNILEHAAHDTLCYHDSQGSRLQDKQAKEWGRWINWAERTFDARWLIGHGITPLSQPAATHQHISSWLHARLEAEVLVLYSVTQGLASFIIGAALIYGELAAEEAVDLAWLEQDTQMERWGADKEAIDKRNACLADVKTAMQFLSLSQHVQESINEPALH